MKKIRSLVKKAKNLDLVAYNEGVKNYNEGNLQDLAIVRSEVCKGCDRLEDEPIVELRVADSIEAISGKMCGACGCSLPYLLRQEIKSCKLKKW